MSNFSFSLSAASGSYTALYGVVVVRGSSQAVVAATGALSTNAAWAALAIAGTYNTYTGEWEFVLPTAMPAGQYKVKFFDASSPAVTDAIVSQATFDKDTNLGIVNFVQID